MGLREVYGGAIESTLNALVDKYLDKETIKSLLVVKLEEFIDEKLDDIKHKIKADIIDLIDGEDDIK